MLILGIETSCDETAAAVVEDGRQIISNVVATSKELHQKTGGIIPDIAAREQTRCIIPVIEEALRQATVKSRTTTHLQLFSSIDAIAVTIGPGLIGSLLVGVETVKTLVFALKKAVVPVNHIFAHIYANWLTPETEIKFPAIALVTSGGHTELFVMYNHGQLKWLGGTRDDAAGEAFDKTARLIGLGFPGGPAIAAEADKFKPRAEKFKVKLPRPMITGKNFEFSFSGLKTAVLREINKLKQEKIWNNQAMSYLAYEIQESITDVLVDKTIKAAQKYKVKSILLGGGVAANKRLTEKFYSQLTTYNLQLFVPPPSLCTDNAAYIASFAFYNYHPVPWRDIQAQPDLQVEV